MGMRDLFDNIKALTCVTPTRVTDNTAQVGAIIDRQGFRSLVYLVDANIPDSDATVTPLLEEGDNSSLSDNSAVDDADLLGTESAATYAASQDGVVMKLGYRGRKRYTRLTLTPGANTGNLDICAIAVLGNPEQAPQDDQSV